MAYGIGANNKASKSSGSSGGDKYTSQGLESIFPGVLSK